MHMCSRASLLLLACHVRTPNADVAAATAAPPHAIRCKTSAKHTERAFNRFLASRKARAIIAPDDEHVRHFAEFVRSRAVNGKVVLTLASGSYTEPLLNWLHGMGTHSVHVYVQACCRR